MSRAASADSLRTRSATSAAASGVRLTGAGCARWRRSRRRKLAHRGRDGCDVVALQEELARARGHPPAERRVADDGAQRRGQRIRVAGLGEQRNAAGLHDLRDAAGARRHQRAPEHHRLLEDDAVRLIARGLTDRRRPRRAARAAAPGRRG